MDNLKPKRKPIQRNPLEQDWDHALADVFLSGLERGYFNMQLAYEAPRLAFDSEIAKQTRAFLRKIAPHMKFPRDISHGLDFHNDQIITRPEYPMKRGQNAMLEEHGDYFASFVPGCALTEWGPGGGDDIERMVSNSRRISQDSTGNAENGNPALVILVDRSFHNLEVTQNKLLKMLPPDQIVLVQDDFYNPELKKHPVWRHVAESGFPRTDIIFGGTPWNTTQENRVPFFQGIAKNMNYKPHSGRHTLFATVDCTQHRETNYRAYNSPTYAIFVTRGFLWGCQLAGCRADVDLLSYRVTFDDKGIITQLYNQASQPVFLDTGVKRPTERLILPEGGLVCTRAEKPSVADCIAEFRHSGWHMVAGRQPDKQTIIYNDAFNPHARLGICQFHPA